MAVTLRKRRVEAVRSASSMPMQIPRMNGASERCCARRCPDLFVTLSHEILREYREYERTSTTALNAYVGSTVEAYLRRLETYLRAGAF